MTPRLFPIDEQPIVEQTLFARTRARDFHGAELGITIGDIPSWKI